MFEDTVMEKFEEKLLFLGHEKYGVIGGCA